MNELKECGPKATTKAMVIAGHPSNTAFKLQAQLLSGLFTCKQWVAQALGKHSPPQVVFYTRINRSKEFRLWLSDALLASTKPEVGPTHAMLEAMSGANTARRLSRAFEADRLATHHRKYVSRHGPRSGLGT